MSIGIYGSSILTLDSKGRMAIPARYRDLLRQSCEGSIVVTKDPQYPSLMIYPGKLWKEISIRSRKSIKKRWNFNSCNVSFFRR